MTPAYFARRLLQGLLVMLLVATAVFVIFRIVPGDPAAMTLGFDAPPAARAAIRAEWGLDRPLYIQYFDWLSNLLTGDLGKSPTHGNAPISGLVFPAFWRTLQLAAASMVLAVAIAVPLGIIAAIHVGRPIDHVARVFSTFGFSMPTYVLGIVGLILFAEVYRVLPPGGYVSFSSDPAGYFRFLALPATTVGVVLAARLTRFMRTGMLEVLGKDYIRFARSKGLPAPRVYVRHALKNASGSFVTEAGVNFGLLIGGMVVIEQIFVWPGLGWLMIQSVLSRAFDVVQAAVLLAAAAFVIVNLVVDFIYPILNPRVTY